MWLVMSQAWKQPRLHDFLTKIWSNVSLVPHSNHETRKIRTKTWDMPNKNLIKFDCKEGIEQGWVKAW